MIKLTLYDAPRGNHTYLCDDLAHAKMILDSIHGSNAKLFAMPQGHWEAWDTPKNLVLGYARETST